MKRQVDISIETIDYHRNGISGEGFHVVLFSFRDEERRVRRMVATVFPGAGRVAVLDRDLTADGNVAFAMGNSWRGDWFEPTLRRAITASDKAAR